MSHESGWTVDTLKEYLDAQFAAAEKAVQAALASVDKAITKADAASDKRFESVNGFRGQLADQARTFIGREEYQTAHQALVDKVEAESSQLRERLQNLELRVSSRLDLRQGQDVGSTGERIERRESRTVLISALSLAVAVVVASAIVLAAFHK